MYFKILSVMGALLKNYTYVISDIHGELDAFKEMLKKINCLKFAVVELALYLDTHPDDKKALCLHNKYSKDLKEICDKYQKVYGPLSIEYPCNKWRWLEEPWPWEGGND